MASNDRADPQNVCRSLVHVRRRMPLRCDWIYAAHGTTSGALAGSLLSMQLLPHPWCPHGIGPRGFDVVSRRGPFETEALPLRDRISRLPDLRRLRRLCRGSARIEERAVRYGERQYDQQFARPAASGRGLVRGRVARTEEIPARAAMDAGHRGALGAGVHSRKWRAREELQSGSLVQ